MRVLSSSSSSSSSLGERIGAQARALCGAAGFSTRAREVDEVLQEMCASWSSRGEEQRPRWSSLTDDCSPIESSVVLAPRPVEVRFCVEAQADPASPASYWEAAQRLNQRLEARFGAHLERLRQLEDLFSPQHRALPMVMWHAVMFGAEGPPSFKIYLWAGARGINQASASCARMLERLGCTRAWERIQALLRPRDVIAFVGLDLQAGEEARVKVYVNHPAPLSAEEYERAASLSPDSIPGDAATFLRILRGDEASAGEPPKTTFHASRQVMTSYRIVPGKAGDIDSVALQFPHALGSPEGALAPERTRSLLREHGLPTEDYERCLSVFSPLANSYISFQRARGRPVITPYFTSRLFAERFGLLTRDWDTLRSWHFPPRATQEDVHG
ncbi:tryptophan dimethylallyltransferase family protein [Melittangium boletus]|uniref:Tryptophan dimethylallyltransferase n=1 Tax=Melittangium boletus DSM 14713 TaxID=1294270 RepID=A0A250IP39_9BACT|nr:tryptophan dimethylallyltransferase family protein [Melittangium boletus]ATB33509.1 hypothetical protein MEBOL_007007 [Melittangium boletus DSM 14713]